MMTYYTIDDLRLPPKRPFHRGWTMERFPTLAEALAWYRVLPASGIKSLGMTSGVHVLELVRCLPLFPGDSEGENVLASCPQELPLWAGEPESIQASETCISALSLRYRLDGTMITPIPPPHGLPRELRDKYLWLSERSGQQSAIRWVYIAGTGWKQPDFLRRWSRPEYPLVLRYRADGITEQGAYLPLEVAPWEYDLLMRRTLERQKNNQNGRNKT